MARIREGKLESLLNKHLQEAGDDKKTLAWKNAGNHVDRLLEAGEVRSSDFSIKGIAEASLRVAGYEGLPRMSAASTKEINEALSGTAFPILTNTVINSTLVSQYETYEEAVDSLVTRGESTNSYKETIGGLQAMGGLLYTPEMHAVEATDFGEKKVEIYLGKFQREIAVTKELMYDDRTGDILDAARGIGKKAGQDLQKSVMQTIAVTNRSIFDFEDSSTYYPAVFNGTKLTQSQFYSNDHSSLSNVYGGQTNDNLVAKSLSVDGLDAARLLFSGMKDEKGDEIVVDPTTLLVPKSLEMDAWQLFNSPGEMDSADRNANPFGPRGLESYNIIASQFLDNIDSSAWYLGDFSEQVVLLSWEDLNTQEMGADSYDAYRKDIVASFKASQGFGLGHRDLIYIIKSSG